MKAFKYLILSFCFISIPANAAYYIQGLKTQTSSSSPFSFSPRFSTYNILPLFDQLNQSFVQDFHLANDKWTVLHHQPT